MENIIGKRFGKLLITSFAFKKKKLHYYNCTCDCGNKYQIFKGALTRKTKPSKSCGCDGPNAFKDISGLKFNELTVIGISHRANKKIYWDCLCSCGKKTKVSGSNIKSGLVRSCGHLILEGIKKANIKHGMVNTRTYKIWAGMIKRCTNPNSVGYKYYGGRGISVCSNWMKFENFLNDMGECNDTNLSIDRINPKGNYEKSNCRWASRSTQAWNTTKNPSRTTGYYGVIKRKRNHGFVYEAYITNYGDKKYLGQYLTAELAAKAYDEASKLLRGDTAKLNFPKKASQPKSSW